MFEGFKVFLSLFFAVFAVDCVLADEPRLPGQGRCLYQISLVANPHEPQKKDVQISAQTISHKPERIQKLTVAPRTSDYIGNSYIINLSPHVLIETFLPPLGDPSIDGEIHVQSLLDPKARAVIPIPHQGYKNGVILSGHIDYPIQIPETLREKVQDLLEIIKNGYRNVYAVAELTKLPHMIMEERKAFQARTAPLDLIQSDQWQTKAPAKRIRWKELLEYWREISDCDLTAATTAFGELIQRLTIPDENAPSDRVQIWLGSSSLKTNSNQLRDEFIIEINTLHHVTFQIVIFGVHR